jgi:hypothetical protein
MTEQAYDVHWEAERLVITYNQAFGHFFRLSPHLTKTGEDRKMVLSAGHCKGAIASFGELLKILLKGKPRFYNSSFLLTDFADVPVKIEEADVELQPPKTWVKRIERGNPAHSSHFASHHIFLVSMANQHRKDPQDSSTQGQRRWYIDITNAQFNIHKPFSEAKEYMKKWGRRYRTIAPLGTANAQLAELCGTRTARMSAFAIIRRQEEAIMETVEDADANWKNNHGYSSQDMLLQGVERIDDLRSWVVIGLDGCIDGWNARYDQDAELADFPKSDSTRDEIIHLEIRKKQERFMLQYSV